MEIVSIGMATAVGLDAPSTCAAMRARLDGFQESRFGGDEDGPLLAAPIPLPRNWVGQRRTAHLAASAIVEAFNGFPQARGRTSLILCLAEEDRVGKPFRDATSLVRTIAEIVESPTSERSRVVMHGRPSGHVALYQARRILSERSSDFVMIAGVDSYLTAEAMAHYLGQERLLSKLNPNGFIPGEAASAVLCAPATGKGLSVAGLGLSREPAHIYNKDDLPLRGDGLAAAYDAALAEAGMELRSLGYRISDLIGEQYWFKQTSLASLRLLRGRHEFQDLWSPAESLGNIGAAVVPLMLGMAYTAMRKNYAAGNPVLIEASNDAGACGAALLRSNAA